jgi:hypothetical protein
VKLPVRSALWARGLMLIPSCSPPSQAPARLWDV